MMAIAKDDKLPYIADSGKYSNADETLSDTEMDISGGKTLTDNSVQFPDFNMISPIPYNDGNNVVSKDYDRYNIAEDKQISGDVAKEKQVMERMKQLGLYETKKFVERQMVQNLEDIIAQDVLVGALRQCRRQRPLKDRIKAVTNQIHNVIQTTTYTDADGIHLYKVQVLMGFFTKDVTHKIDGNLVTITGTTPRWPKLSKEIKIELPRFVEVENADAVYKAGVFKMIAPIRSRPQRRQRTSEISGYYSGYEKGMYIRPSLIHRLNKLVDSCSACSEASDSDIVDRGSLSDFDTSFSSLPSTSGAENGIENNT